MAQRGEACVLASCLIHLSKDETPGRRGGRGPITLDDGGIVVTHLAAPCNLSCGWGRHGHDTAPWASCRHPSAPSQHEMSLKPAARLRGAHPCRRSKTVKRRRVAGSATANRQCETRELMHEASLGPMPALFLKPPFSSACSPTMLAIHVQERIPARLHPASPTGDGSGSSRSCGYAGYSGYCRGPSDSSLKDSPPAVLPLPISRTVLVLLHMAEETYDPISLRSSPGSPLPSTHIELPSCGGTPGTAFGWSFMLSQTTSTHFLYRIETEPPFSATPLPWPRRP